MPNFKKSKGYKMKGSPMKRNFGVGAESPMKAESFSIKGEKATRQEYVDYLKSKGKGDIAEKHAKKLPKKTYKSKEELRAAMADKK